MRALLLILATLLSACAPTLVSTRDNTAITAPGWYDVSGKPVSEDRVMSTIQNADYVLVGETHDDAGDHALQLEILNHLLGKRQIALGMEMFQRPFQPALDAYIAGEVDEAEMLERSEYKARWGFDTAFYAPLWTAARDAKIPLIALNTRRELTKRVAAVGLNGLTEWEKNDLPEVDESNIAYFDWLRAIFASHGMDTDTPKFGRFVQAQLLWDETMADTAVKARQRAGIDAVVVIVGRGHVERGWGIPSRISRRDPEATVISIVRVAELQQNDPPLATFVLVEPR